MSGEMSEPQVEGFYYPQEIERHQSRQESRKMLGLRTYELTVPKAGHNYRGGIIQWETEAPRITRERGQRYVLQAENVVMRHLYRAGTANFDRYLIVGHGLHHDTENGQRDGTPLAGSLHVTLLCDNSEMRASRVSYAIHQYIDDSERYNINPWIGECSIGHPRRRGRKAQRTSTQFLSRGPSGQFEPAEFGGLNLKLGKQASQQISEDKIDSGDRSPLRQLMWCLSWKTKDTWTHCLNKTWTWKTKDIWTHILNKISGFLKIWTKDEDVTTESPSESHKIGDHSHPRIQNGLPRSQKGLERRALRRSRKETSPGPDEDESDDELIGIASFL